MGKELEHTGKNEKCVQDFSQKILREETTLKK
jgi:hypothetical protein